MSRADLAKEVLEQEKTHLTELYHKTEEEREEYETDCKYNFINSKFRNYVILIILGLSGQYQVFSQLLTQLKQWNLAKLNTIVSQD